MNLKRGVGIDQCRHKKIGNKLQYFIPTLAYSDRKMNKSQSRDKIFYILLTLTNFAVIMVAS